MPPQFRDADSAKEAQLLETWKAYKKGFQEGISKFNKKPKQGISFMQVGPQTSRVDRYLNWHCSRMAPIGRAQAALPLLLSTKNLLVTCLLHLSSHSAKALEAEYCHSGGNL